MDVAKAMRQIRQMMNDNGLEDWKLGAEPNIFDAGRTSLRREEIRISAPFIEVNNWDIVRKTAIHEMAHAEVHVHGLEDDHGPLWKREAAALGDPHPHTDLEAGVTPGVVAPFTEAESQTTEFFIKSLVHDAENQMGKMSDVGVEYY